MRPLMVDGRASRADRVAVANRTGPIGRLVRAGWAAAAALTLASIVDSRGPARFRNPHILSEPSAWLLHILMLFVFVVLVGTLGATLGDRRTVRRAQAAALMVLATIGGLAAVIGQLRDGLVWGFPLADAVWSFDVLMLAEQLAAFILAIALATPGCEIGVWRELIARSRGQPAPPTGGLACVVGLHLVDRWEAARTAASRRVTDDRGNWRGMR